MTYTPVTYGTVNGEPVTLPRFDRSRARRNGLVFTDDTQNGQLAYHDLQDLILSEVSENDIEVFLVDPNNNCALLSHKNTVDTHSVSVNTLGNPCLFKRPSGMAHPIDAGIEKVQSLFLTFFGTQAIEFTYSQQDLLFELLKQIFLDTNHTAPSLNFFAEELCGLCEKSSQEAFKHAASSLHEFNSSGSYSALGMLSGELDTGKNPIQQYTFTQQPADNGYPPELMYHALLNTLLTHAQNSSKETWVVLTGYEWFLTDTTNKYTIEMAMRNAAATNTVYEIVVENLSNFARLPPINNWYNDGRYTRYYTTDAPSTLGALPTQYDDWLDDPESDTQSRSVLTVNDSDKGPHHLHSTAHTDLG